MAVQGTERTGVNIAKAAVKTTATAAAVAGTTLLLARTGQLDRFVGKSKVTDRAINGAKGLADDIAKFAEPHLATARTKLGSVTKAVKASRPFKAVAKFADDAVNFVRTRLGKFNPDLASAKDKMAETFNNFTR